MSNIVIFSHFKPFPPNHGFAHRVWHLALDLKKKGHTVTILHNAIHGQNKKIVNKIQEITIIQVPFLFSFFQKKHFIFQANPLIIFEFFKLNNEKKIDIIQIELPYLIVITFFLRFMGKKIVYDAHGVEYRWQSIMYQRKGIILFSIKFIEKWALKLSNRALCCSEEDKSTFIREYKINDKKIKVVPSLIDVNAFKHIKPFKFKKKTVLFIGSSLHPANKEAIEKIYYEILPTVVKKVKNVQFCFIGKNPPEYLQGKNVMVFGEVDDVKPYIKGAQICIAPIFKGTGTRIKILEYLAGCKRVVVTHKAVEGIETQSKKITFAEDIDSFAEDIIQLLL